ncbi:MAG: 30S ribosomal protein S8e [DPANN group archaeon]|nr:30S ribosomal protein S8e [DPANN group archaeon]
MAIYHTRSKRKPTGGLHKDYVAKKNHQVGREFTKTVIGEKKVRVLRGRGGNESIALRQDNKVNFSDEKGKTKVEMIDSVVENKANLQFVRAGIVTKGAIVKTKAGNIKITSRPGQHGILNGVIVK